MTPTFTDEQWEQMRNALAQRDAATAKKGMQEFDLNNPPHQNYRHQEYPCAMYNHETGAMRPAKNAAEQADAEAAGWTREATPPLPEPEIELSAADQEAAAEIDAQLIKRGPGRPKKTE